MTSRSEGDPEKIHGTEAYRQRAETHVLSEPLLSGLGNIAQNPAAYRLAWMFDEVAQELAVQPEVPYARWCNIAFTTDPTKKTAEDPMIKKVMAVIGTKIAETIDFEFVFTTPESWQGYLNELDKRDKLGQ